MIQSQNYHQTSFGKLIEEYNKYHNDSAACGDIDPSYPMLRYVCDRYELNIEQRYWLAFLYACCYCGPTVFYIYNEFPDFENVDLGRLNRWWNKNKKLCYFQKDRLRIQTMNLLSETFESYRSLIYPINQAQKFSLLCSSDKIQTYKTAWAEMSKIKNFGRFSMFLYLEAVHVVTGFPMEPDNLDLSQASTCKDGLAYALRRDDLVGNPNSWRLLQPAFSKLMVHMKAQNKQNTVWNVETSLCAFKKYKEGRRYVGYYLDRQHDEIKILQSRVTSGVDWSVLWDFRRETFKKEFLKERS